MFSNYSETDQFNHRKILYFGQLEKDGETRYNIRILKGNTAHTVSVTQTQRADILAQYKPTNTYALGLKFTYQNNKIKNCELLNFEKLETPRRTSPKTLEAHFAENSILGIDEVTDFYRDRHDGSYFSEGATKTPKTWAYNGCICFCFQCAGYGANSRIKKFPRAPRLWRIKNKKS